MTSERTFGKRNGWIPVPGSAQPEYFSIGGNFGDLVVALFPVMGPELFSKMSTSDASNFS